MKRVGLVVEVFRRIRQRVRARLIMIGDGPDRQVAERQVTEAGLGEVVDFFGEEQDLVPWLSSADLFLLTSAQESFGLAALEARDRALAREIVAGTLRNRSLLDFRLAGLLEEPENLPPAVLNLLRMSAYQLLYLNRLPPYAVVNDAVELAGGMAKGAFTGVVNGVLRNLARRGKAASLLEPADAKSNSAGPIRFIWRWEERRLSAGIRGVTPWDY